MQVAAKTQIEQFGNGVSREWLFDGRMTIITTEGMTRDTIDTWGEVTETTMQNWTPEQPFLTVQDLSKGGLTPYARQKAKNITVKLVNPRLTGRYAVVLSDTLLSRAIMFFIRTTLDRDNAPLDRGFFTNREDAIRWLAELL